MILSCCCSQVQSESDGPGAIPTDPRAAPSAPQAAGHKAAPSGPRAAPDAPSMPQEAELTLPISIVKSISQSRARGRATGSRSRPVANRAKLAEAVSNGPLAETGYACNSLPAGNGAQDCASSGVRDGRLANPRHCSHCWATSESPSE